MGENIEIEVDFKVKDDELNKASKKVDDIGDKSAKASQKVSLLQKAFNTINAEKLANAGIVLATFGKSLLGIANNIKQFIDEGINLNKNLENLQTRIQSLVNVADKSANLSPFDKWQKSGETAKKILNDLKALDSELDFNQSDLADMFASFYIAQLLRI